MPNRREFLAALAGGAMPARQRPNFVFLFTDDQRFDTVAALGHPVVRTPNMDRLVRRGVAFTHACTQGGLIGGICVPSRAQLMTGKSVFRVHKHIIDRAEDPDPSYVTFPQRLRESGYTTFVTGKWHNGPPLLQRSFSQGSTIFFGGMSDHLKVPVFEYNASGEYPKQQATIAKKFSSETFTDSALRFLKDRDASKPFLLYLAYTAPHDPRMAPKRFADLYRPRDIELPRNFLPEHPIDNGNLRGRDEMLAGFPRTPDEVRRHIAAYYGMISEVDSEIGRVLDTVERSGQAENTYIIWAGDNGLAVGQHGLFGKQNMYDHSLRVPMVISGPGIAGGRKVDGMCHVMDLCPTICDLAGVPAPQALDARSLKPALANPRAPLRSEVIAAFRHFQRAIRTDRWKLILYNVEGKRATQLFDLREDPLEMKNLASDAGQAGRIRELKALMQQRLREAGDHVDLDGEWTA